MVPSRLHTRWKLFRVSPKISMIQTILLYYHPDTYASYLIRYCNTPSHFNILGRKGTLWVAVTQQCGIPHPVRHPLILRPLSRKNPSWRLSTSTNTKEIKGLSKMPGSSWNQKSQIYYNGLRFPIKSPPRPLSDIPGRIIGSFFGRMGNPLGLRGVL